MKRNKQFYARKLHRYLGLFIGIQFIGWTISGLYFSWNNIDDVHGDHMRKEVPALTYEAGMISPDSAFKRIESVDQFDSLHSFKLIRITDKQYYQIGYYSKDHSGHKGHVSFKLVNASTGELREPLDKDMAIKVASEQLVSPAKLKNATLLSEVGDHHEYRGRRLPVWAVDFDDPDCTVYVSPELGTFQTIRHDQWRVFDFLWMFHTMDYAGRDDFNNWLLKLFSIFGLFTVISGFVLFVMSSRTIKKLRK
ncbi:PepSY domain-containing protein [Mangrovivirga sp. M17]|uniref:PepSY domain-containing protein n=1 Tax=Mangrovivirga halotolerans TaxID=2993936 RepID=A0ABT3RNJ6_9BACT|nr:PepSY domain-containing protein [Mangrovivirga halotolerans]MCX2743046.1 PepSY domain-containing protein [Mangrovivirga halotolerans]